MSTVKFVLVALVLAIAPACTSKSEEKKAPPATAPAPTPPPPAPAPAPTPPPAAGTEGSAAPPAADTAAPAAAAEADYIEVVASHAPAKPTDPVSLKFDKVTVTKSKVDPAKLEGGSATIEVDLTSLKSDSGKRDSDVKDGYLEVGKFATMTIDVGDVKKKDDKRYTAKAKVKLHGVDKTYPVEFEVVEAKDDWVRIKGEHKLSRLDFKIGKKEGAEDGVAEALTVRVQLTLKKA